MRQVQKLFFVPVGLPGMGKSTLAKNIRLSIEKNLSHNRQNPSKTGNGPQLPQASNLTSLEPLAKITDTSPHNGQPTQMIDPSLQRFYADSLPSVDFQKISYDRILGDQTNSYLESHPDVPFHEVIDIIRPMADAEYLD